jgi:hypothetical protein
VVNVVWLSYHPETVRARGYADQGLVEWVIAEVIPDAAHRAAFEDVPDGHGAIVVVPARHHARDAARLTADLARLPWALVVLTGDEGAEFPWRELAHPNMRLWVQTPDPVLHAGAGRFLGDGPSAWLPSLAGSGVPAKTLPWCFAGQVTHDARWRCHEALRRQERKGGGGFFFQTDGFMRGLPPAEYLGRMLAAKVCPAPSGPCTPDTFRLYEALDAGAVPIADGREYWDFLFGDVPFPVVGDWLEAPGLIDLVLADWTAWANRCFAWWQGVLARLRWDLADNLEALSGSTDFMPISIPAVTVLVPTSPIPTHPSTAAIEETLASVRAQLPGAEVLVMIDGVRPEQERMRPAYGEYVRRLLWLCRHHWHRTVPLLHEVHRHQAAMTRQALDLVRTPLVLFVEHDCPIHGEVPWAGLATAVDSGRANLVRLHHESEILPDHRHLMLDGAEPQGDPPMVRTFQWSQRPHLASTAFYRRVIEKHFASDARTMIEDVMHGVAEHWGFAGEWERFKLHIYAPPGDMKRSWHLDARGDQPKYGMHFSYPDESPPGAPWPSEQEVSA